MEYGFIKINTTQDLANAIRKKTGSEEQFTPSQIANQISGFDLSEDQLLKQLIERSIETFEVPNGITKIGSQLCNRWSSLKKVVIPEGVISIGSSAFKESGITEIDLPSSLEIIGSQAFWECEALKTITLPENIKTLGKNLFYESGLESIILPASITSLGETFHYARNLKNVTFKGTPSSISSSAFEGCDNLILINVPWAEGEVTGAPWGAANATIVYNYSE